MKTLVKASGIARTNDIHEAYCQEGIIAVNDIPKAIIVTKKNHVFKIILALICVSKNNIEIAITNETKNNAAKIN